MLKNRSGKNYNRIIKSNIIITLTLFCVVLAAVSVFSNSFMCYAVSYDGAMIGQVSTRSELQAAVEEAESVASNILGEECDIADSLTVTTSIGSAGSAADLTDMLLENVEGITKQYAITVNGTPVGTLESEEALTSILSSILDRYSTADTVSTDFVQEVGISLMFISEDLESDPDEIAWLLSPENTDSAWSLTVVSQSMSEGVEVIPYNIEYVYSTDMYSDERVLLQEGHDGERSITYLTRGENGTPVSTIIASSYTVLEPVSEIISIGTLPGSRTDSTGTYIWPADGIVSSYYGYRNVNIGSTNHKGLDIANDVGTPVYAADGGTVIFAQFWDGSGYGNLIEIEHDNGDVTYYGHLSKILVEEGDKVAQGDLIGEMGATGNVSGPHLHFEIRPDGGSPVDPEGYLS